VLSSTSIGAVTTTERVVVRKAASDAGASASVIRSGILLPVLARSGRFLEVMTPCERVGFVPSSGVQGFAQEAHPAKTLAQATIVVDPGHGGSETGAVGPHGLKESDVNLDIAKRLLGRLPGARVFLTRTGNYDAGLGFRAAIANGLHADAFVSVHNNADPDGPSSKPGTETYYQIASAASKRLAGLAYEELLPTLERFKVSWVSDKDAGAKYRTNTHGLDYYGVLRHSHVPAIITESLYITNAPEEALLSHSTTRQAIADALGRAVDRFVTTTDPGSGFVTPLVRNEGAPFALPTDCHDPS
jgi:N-acetylmuramoyl-L-alanine amidase